jgi:hypothetical protein
VIRPYRDARQHCAAHVQIMVWCRDCGHRVEPDPAELAERYGADTSVLELTVGATEGEVLSHPHRSGGPILGREALPLLEGASADVQ